jgi:hypothetical protein
MRPTPTSLSLLLAALVLPSGKLAAQADSHDAFSAWIDQWEARAAAAKASQPDWITPLATTTPRLEQEFRYDQNRQSLKNGSTVDVYDNGKGLELIPTEQTEIIIAAPPYQVRQGASPASGFNDWPGVTLKYRLVSANKENGDHIVTLFLQYGLPTGIPVYTSHNHVITPTLALGKGWGDFDVQATLGEAFPTHDNSRAGRSVLTNVTAQYHVAPLLWPELELNRTDWAGGSRDGRSQTYLTTGVVVGRFILSARSKLILGLGYQTPLSSVYAKAPATPTFSHNWILSARVTF